MTKSDIIAKLGKLIADSIEAGGDRAEIDAFAVEVSKLDADGDDLREQAVAISGEHGMLWETILDIMAKPNMY